MGQTGRMRHSGHHRQLLFVIASLVLISIEVLQLELVQDRPLDFVVLSSSALVVAALAATGFWMVPGGITVVLLVVLQNALVSGAAIGVLSVYLVVALWISQGWWLGAAVALVVVEGSALIWTTMPGAQLLSSVFGSFLAVAIGLFARYMLLRNRTLVTVLEDAEARSRKDLEAVQQSINTVLHDDIASRLVGIVALVERIEEGGGEARDVDLLKFLTAEALRSSRGLMHSHKEVQGRRLAETIEEAQLMLDARQMRLVPRFLGGSPISEDRDPLLSLVVWEGCVNALKHGVGGSSVEAVFEDTSDDLRTVTITNQRIAENSDAEVSAPQENRDLGGFGLQNLERQIVASGGDLATWSLDGPVGGTWVLMAEVPIRSLPNF